MLPSAGGAKSTSRMNGSRSLLSTATGGAAGGGDAAAGFSSMALVSSSKTGTSATIKSPPRLRLSAHSGTKISKIRWLNSRQGFGGLVPDTITSEYFVTGSWGEQENGLSLWKLSVRGSSAQAGEEELEADIQGMHRLPLLGNVSDIATLKNDFIALTTSSGVASLYKVNTDQSGSRTLELASSKKLHQTPVNGVPCPANGIAALDRSITSVGDDGSIFELSSVNFEILQTFQAVDDMSLCCVEYTSARTIATGNNGGQVKIWDLRSGEKPLTQTLNHLDDLSSAISIAPHPTMPHLLLVGYTSGGTDLWDLRGSSSEPVANLQMQDGAVSEIWFHPIYPDNFYTCCQSGEVVHWFTARNIADSDLVQNNDYNTDLNLDFLKYGLNCKTLYSSPLPINSMSLSSSDRIVCGGDSGMMFCTEKS